MENAAKMLISKGFRGHDTRGDTLTTMLRDRLLLIVEAIPSKTTSNINQRLAISNHFKSKFILTFSHYSLTATSIRNIRPTIS